MNYSFYEIYITAQRAFTAMGFPYGADEDAAYIIAWLELNNFNGIVLLANKLNELNQKFEGKIKLNNFNENINFENKSILMKGSGLIDFLKAELEIKDQISVKIINCKEGILFLPLLYKNSEFLKLSKLSYCYSDDEMKIYEIIDNKIIYYTKKNKDLLNQNEITIFMSKNKINSNNHFGSEIISEKKIQQNLSRSLKPETKAWYEVSMIANKTFVPESDESRNKGAGGGDDND